MRVSQLQDLSPDEAIEADICLVGSGPAGVTLARELTGSGLRVVLLESGGREPAAEADSLSEIENVGAPREIDQTLARPRMLGGASTLWSGRCAPFDAIDFERRAWVPHSGWPIGLAELTPFFTRTAGHLGLGIGAGFADAGPPSRRASKPPRRPLNERIVRPFFWQFSRDAGNRHDSMRFGKLLLSHVADNVHAVLHASVLRVVTDVAVTGVQSVVVAAPDGTKRSVAARAVVLCAGGIENARLLLASNDAAPAGLGNAHDQVGRFLMDHPRGGVAVFDHMRPAALDPYMGMQLLQAGAGRYLFCKGLRLSPDVQAAEGLLNCAVWLSEMVQEDDPLSAMKRLLRRQGNRAADLRSVATNLPLFARGVGRAVAGGVMPRKLGALELNCTVEQRPDPDSRITLSDRVDRYGIPLSRLHWRVNEQERHTVRRTAALVTQELTRVGVPHAQLMDWVRDGETFPPTFRDVAHHIGTTRMSAAPGDGVVDTDCQVHGIGGLYVAGSSVFPTAGHANPTQMIVALAIRLADTLKRRLSDRR